MSDMTDAFAYAIGHLIVKEMLERSHKMAFKRYDANQWQSPIDDAFGTKGRPSASSSSSRYQPRGSNKGIKIAQLEMVADGKMMHLDCGYHKDLIGAIKSSIPSNKRYYDAGDKTWYIVSDQFEKLSVILETYFDQTVLINFPAQHADSDAWSQMWLLEGAPLEVVTAVYKTLAKLHHPDRGGDPELMTRVNVAYKEILGELAEQNGEEDKDND